MSTATYVKTVGNQSYPGDARLYKLDPPYNGDDPYTGESVFAEHVIVSAIPVSGFVRTPETYIFPATETGEVTDWGELPGSFQGDMDHERALTGLGYQIVEVAQQ